MSLLDNALVTLDEAQRWLKISDPDLDVDTLETLIDGITGDFESETQRKLKIQTVAAYQLNGSGCDTIRLPYRPVTNVSSILILNQDGSTSRQITNESSPESLANSEFTVNPGTGEVRLYSGIFIEGRNNIIVTFKAGYASASPEMKRIRKLFFVQLKFEYSQDRDNNFGVASRQFQDSGITFERSAEGLLPRVTAALDYLRLKHGP